MRRYFLGLAANLSTAECWRHVLGVGLGDERRRLREFLAEKYDGRAILTKNGRSALALALMEYLEPGEAVLVNGFTCYAVYEAIEAAGLRPVWVDINRGDLNFNVETLERAMRRDDGGGARMRKEARSELRRTGVGGGEGSKIRGIIVQNTLGNPVEMAKIEKFAKKHGLVIIEDLAHCVGARYPDGREVGTVGVAVALSFGKDKRIDATSGGAVVLRGESRAQREASRAESEARGEANKTGKTRKEARNELRGTGVEEPSEAPRFMDCVRARFYPFFGVVARNLTYLHLSTPWMWVLLKLKLVERSADNRLDLTRQIAKLEAKCALRQLRELEQETAGGAEKAVRSAKKARSELRGTGVGKSGVSLKPLRRFYLVENRAELLGKLKERGYYFGGFWYERPVAPERYYARVKFPEKECPVATEVARQIVNVPEYYSAEELAPAVELIKEYAV